MYRRSDPRFRRTINEISQTFESANESAQVNIFTFSHRYLGPCFSTLGSCFQSCTSCFGCHQDRVRRTRTRSRARPETSFDFYDDWDDDETAGLLAWDHDDLDAGLSANQRHYGAGATSVQPARERAMSYGARRDKYRGHKSQPPDSEATSKPTSSYFGFITNMSSKLTGAKSLRYKPSAADLQDHPGASRTMPTLAEEDLDEFTPRKRSNTHGSTGTADSFSSRGDLFPSEDEDDALELDDEFAMVLERRPTGTGQEDVTSTGKPRRPGKRPSTGSRQSTRTMSDRSTRSSNRRSRAASISPSRDKADEQEFQSIPSMSELKQQEDIVREEEESAIANKRDAARELALQRGLGFEETCQDDSREEQSPIKEQMPLANVELLQDKMTNNDTVPVPSLDSPTEDRQDFVPAKMPHFPGS
jgi:hypothetical protein